MLDFTCSVSLSKQGINHIKMCEVQDVYHVKCGHWSPRPKVKKACVRCPVIAANELYTAPTSTYSEKDLDDYPPMSEPQEPISGLRIAACPEVCRVGNVKDFEQRCSRCRLDIEVIVSHQEGMCFSVLNDPVTGKMRIIDRQSHDVQAKETSGSKTHPVQVHVQPQRQSTQVDPSDRIVERGEEWDSSWSSHGHVEL